MDSWDTGAAGLREVPAEDGDALCNTDLLLPDLLHITFALDRFELEGRKLRKRLGAVVYTAFPKPQVTLPSSARQSQDVMPLSPTAGFQAPMSCMHTLLRRVPLDRRGKASLERHRNALKTCQVIKTLFCKSLGSDYSSQGNFYFCLDYPKALIMLNWLWGQSLTCVPSASHHGIWPARLTPDGASRAPEALCTIPGSGCAPEGTRDLCFYRCALPPAANAADLLQDCTLLPGAAFLRSDGAVLLAGAHNYF